MRLKEIKPDCVIHFKTKEEMQTFKNYMGISLDVDFIWNYTKRSGEKVDCLMFINGKFEGFDCLSFFEREGKEITEFSDLIMPELTAEEVLQIVQEICKTSAMCNLCPLNASDDLCVMERTKFDANKIIEICTKWKEEHEKKEPELEWVYICRIIEVKDNGQKSCVHEVELKDSMGFENELETILKDYIATHEGKYFACREYICRVKESED